MGLTIAAISAILTPDQDQMLKERMQALFDDPGKPGADWRR